MSLLETLRQDHKSARLARDEIRANLLGTLIGGIESEQKSEKQADRPLDDRQITAAISKMLNDLTRNEALMIDQPGREQQIIHNRREQVLLSAYLPQQLSEDEITAFAEARKTEKKGAIMAALRATHPNQYDGKTASTIIDRVLGS
jgi:uncharacterized protein YqeY